MLSRQTHKSAVSWDYSHKMDHYADGKYRWQNHIHLCILLTHSFLEDVDNVDLILKVWFMDNILALAVKFTSCGCQRPRRQ